MVSNPIDTDLFTPARDDERDALRARFGLSGPTITYAGRLGPEKNIEVLLRAVATLRDSGVAAELAIAGHGSHEPILRALATELRIDQQVRFFGTLAQDELARLLRISDTFAIMSTSETQSMVLLQAMASGVPVVAADTRALAGVRRSRQWRAGGPARSRRGWHGRSRICWPRRSDGGSWVRRAGDRAERYGVETVTDAWETLYRSVLNGSSAE